MPNNSKTKPPLNPDDNGLEHAKGQFLVYQAEDGKLKLDVRFEDESVWLTQQLMADLFQTTKQNISLHIQNIYEECELVPEATVKKYLTVRSEGNRWIKKLDSFMTLNDRDILTHAGKVSHEMAKQLAEGVYEKFHTSGLAESSKQISDFDKVVKQIESSKNKEAKS